MAIVKEFEIVLLVLDLSCQTVCPCMPNVIEHLIVEFVSKLARDEQELIRRK